MNATEILAKQDITKLLEYYGFENITQEGDKIRSCCKIHGGNNPSAFVVDVNTNLYFCHTGCGKGGHIFTLVMVMEDCSFRESVTFLSKFYDVDIQGLEIKEREEKYIKDIKNFIRVVRKKRREINEYNPKYTRKDVKRFRNFKEETIEYFGMFYVEEIEIKTNGKTCHIKSKLFFPIVWEGKRIGALLRRTNEKEKLKWSNQPISLPTGDLLYNYDNAKGKYDIVVVEGITDVWAFHEIGVTAVSTFGANLTKEQFYLLIKTGANITLCYDGDKAGRKATEKAKEMLKNKADVYYIQMNEGEDPESISREELMLRYEHRTKV